MQKLVLRDQKLIFADINNKHFGSSITIDITAEENRKEIEKFYDDNGLKPPRYKEYFEKETGEGVKQITIRLAKFAKIADRDDKIYELDDLTQEDAEMIKLIAGAKINLTIRVFKYENDFGSGKSSSVSAIKIVSFEEENKEDDLNELLN